MSTSTTAPKNLSRWDRFLAWFTDVAEAMEAGPYDYLDRRVDRLEAELKELKEAIAHKTGSGE